MVLLIDTIRQANHTSAFANRDRDPPALPPEEHTVCLAGRYCVIDLSDPSLQVMPH
jgi:hypothetical protein